MKPLSFAEHAIRTALEAVRASIRALKLQEEALVAQLPRGRQKQRMDTLFCPMTGRAEPLGGHKPAKVKRLKHA